MSYYLLKRFQEIQMFRSVYDVLIVHMIDLELMDLDFLLCVREDSSDA